MPVLSGKRLTSESAKRTFDLAMIEVRSALTGVHRRAREEVEGRVGRILEDVLVRSEELQIQSGRSQAEWALAERKLETLRVRIDGIIAKNERRLGGSTPNALHPHSQHESFVRDTWSWLMRRFTR